MKCMEEKEWFIMPLKYKISENKSPLAEEVSVIPIRCFVNAETGEVKLYSSKFVDAKGSEKIEKDLETQPHTKSKVYS